MVFIILFYTTLNTLTGSTLWYYTSSTQRRSLKKCASEKRNVEEVRHKIKVSNHGATRLVRNLAESKPIQSGSLFTIRCYGDHVELPNRKLKNPLEGWLLSYDILASRPTTTRNYSYCQAPISSGNIGKWRSKIFFGWKNCNIHFLFFF